MLHYFAPPDWSMEGPNGLGQFKSKKVKMTVKYNNTYGLRPEPNVLNQTVVTLGALCRSLPAVS
jgi:hypothetical protein